MATGILHLLLLNAGALEETEATVIAADAPHVEASRVLRAANSSAPGGAAEVGVVRLQTMRDDVVMPQVAVGTSHLQEDDLRAEIRSALAVGLRHFDFAEVYNSHRIGGEELALAGVPRAELFVTSKIRPCTGPPDGCTEEALNRGALVLRELNMTYVDLLLIHWPQQQVRAAAAAGLVRERPELPSEPCSSPHAPPIAPLPSPTPYALRPTPQSVRRACFRMRAQWAGLERMWHAGKARAIGVSNFCPQLIECISPEIAISVPSLSPPPPQEATSAPATAHVPPAVNQIRLHAGMGPNPGGIASYCARRGIALEAYSALGGAQRGEVGVNLTRSLRTSPVLRAIGTAYGRSAAEVALRWVHQLGHAVIVKSTSAHHLGANARMAAWALSDEHMRQISAMTAPRGGNYSSTCNTEGGVFYWKGDKPSSRVGAGRARRGRWRPTVAARDGAGLSTSKQPPTGINLHPMDEAPVAGRTALWGGASTHASTTVAATVARASAGGSGRIVAGKVKHQQQQVQTLKAKAK